MGLKDIGESLPPGFKFYPSDEELVCHYLRKKIDNEELLKGTLLEIDLHTCEPWQLPDMAKLNANEWYFFSFRDRKYTTGYRTNRATTSGYWKATGKDRVILDPITRVTIGMRKTLVFYKSRAPNGVKTGWIMHEFRLENPHMPPKEDWVLCRVFHKSRSGDNTTTTTTTNNGSPLHMFDQINGGSCTTVPSLSLPSSPHMITTHEHQPIMPCGYLQQQQHHHHQVNSFSSSTLSSTPQVSHNNQSALDLALLSNPSFLHCLKDQSNSNSFINLKSDGDHEDQYGFFWDMNLVDCGSWGDDAATDHHPGHHHHDLGDMEFEDDNGIVLI